MSDNVVVSAAVGVGETFATDDVGGIQFPRSKIVWGADGVANDTEDATGKRLPVNVGAINDVAPAVSSGLLNTGTLRVVLATDQPSLTNTQPVGPKPLTSGGLSVSKTVSAASTNATVVKASAGQVYSVIASNVNAAARYLKIYNKATTPTVGTDTPVMTLIIPGNTAGSGIVFDCMGVEMSAGISFALTTEATDTGTTAVSANEHVINIFYK